MPAVDQWGEWRFAADVPILSGQVPRANPFRRMKLVARKRKVVRRNLSHVNLHLARRLHCVAVIQHATRAADFGNPFDGEQHARFVVRSHRKSSCQSSVVSRTSENAASHRGQPVGR